MQMTAGLAGHLLGAAAGRRAGGQHSNRLSPGCATWHGSNAQQPHRRRRQAALQLRAQIMRAQQLRLPTCSDLCRSRQSSRLVAAAKYRVHSFKNLCLLGSGVGTTGASPLQVLGLWHPK